MHYYLHRHQRLFWTETFSGLQNSWPIWKSQISKITANTEWTTYWIRTSYKNINVMKRWSLPRSLLPEAGDEKSFMASSTHMSSLNILYHRWIQRGGSRIWLQRVLFETYWLWSVTDLLADQISTLIATIWDSTGTAATNVVCCVDGVLKIS